MDYNGRNTVTILVMLTPNLQVHKSIKSVRTSYFVAVLMTYAFSSFYYVPQTFPNKNGKKMT